MKILIYIYIYFVWDYIINLTITDSAGNQITGERPLKVTLEGGNYTPEFSIIE